jgi:Rha family phage regulatory protein
MQDFELILSDVSDVNGVPMTTSRRVAARFGKTPSVVNRAIRALVETEEGLCNFAPTTYTDSQGKTQPEFLISKDGFCLLAMGFTGPDALTWKRAFLKAFNRMAEEIARSTHVPAVPLTLHEQALKLHAESKTSETLATIYGRGLRKRRDEKPVFAQQIAMMREALQLCIALDLPGLPDIT